MIQKIFNIFILLICINQKIDAQSLLYFKDNYNNMYITNSNRYSKDFDQQGIYTKDQLADLIVVNGYIPVATASEFDNLRITTTQTMGSGTPWVDNYTTGLDKKYVQIYNIDFNSYGAVVGNISITGVYDGNEVLCSNITVSEASLFGAVTGTMLNTRIEPTYTSVLNSAGMFCTTLTTGTITNCHVENGTLSTALNNIGGFVHILTSGTITSSSCSGSITGVTWTGGFVATQNGGSIIDCDSYVIVNSLGSDSGGFVATQFGGSISKSESFGNVVNTVASFYMGGFVGEAHGQIDDCRSFSNIIGISNYNGGFVARNRPGAIINNCYSVGTISGSGNIGGFCALNGAAINNSYWDTIVSGIITSSGGIGKTTTEMKQGTPSPAIYTGWSLLIWNFGTTNDYPILL